MIYYLLIIKRCILYTSFMRMLINNLFINMNSQILGQIFLFLIMGIFIGIAQSVGIGGGPFLNVSLMVGLGYDVKESICITYILIMGGAVASTLSNYKKKDKIRNRPVIDGVKNVISLPMVASGSIFGTMLNHYMNQFIITISFVILLIYLVWFFKVKYQQASNQNISTNSITLLQAQINNESSLPISGRIAQIINQERVTFDKTKLKYILTIFIITTFTLLAKGGRNYDSYIGVEKCGWGSWVCIMIHFFASIFLSLSFVKYQKSIDLEKQNLGFIQKDPNDRLQWSKIQFLMLSGFISGLLAGALAIGAALVLIPFWVSVGIDSEKATTSMGPINVFSSTISYVLALLSHSFSSFTEQLLYFILAFIGSYLVKDLVKYISQKYHLKAVNYFLLLVVMALSLLTLGPYQLRSFYLNPEKFMQFGIFC